MRYVKASIESAAHNLTTRFSRFIRMLNLFRIPRYSGVYTALPIDEVNVHGRRNGKLANAAAALGSLAWLHVMHSPVL